MDLHSLKPTGKRKMRKRVGRGNGNNWGRTCGRGEKGQMSRSGANHRPHFEGGQIPLIRRLPKYGFTSRNHRLFAVVNVTALEKHFEAGDEVNFLVLAQKGMIIGKLDHGLKILGQGDLTKALNVTAHAFSATAKAKIEAAGGTCTEGLPNAPVQEATVPVDEQPATPAEDAPAPAEPTADAQE